jgi:hypothetical protein
MSSRPEVIGEVNDAELSESHHDDKHREIHGYTGVSFADLRVYCQSFARTRGDRVTLSQVQQEWEGTVAATNKSADHVYPTMYRRRYRKWSS